MNRSLSSRVGVFSQVSGLAIVAAFAGCSSTDSGSGTQDSGGGQSADVSQPSIDGPGMTCPTKTQVTTAVKVTLNFKWDPVLAVQGGTGDIVIWLLSNYTVNGNTVTGTTQTCGLTIPPLILNATGNAAEGLPPPPAPFGKLDNITPDMAWIAADAMGKPTMPMTATKGEIGGWNVGSSFRTDLATSLVGLTATDPLSNPAMKWPKSQKMLTQADIIDSDNDMKPGLTVVPSTMNGFIQPKNNISGGQPVDKLYVASRTELGLYGKSTSCTTSEGTATAPLYQVHVIGCHIVGGADCVEADSNGGGFDFIDQNATVYCGANSPNCMSPQPATGTYKSVEIPMPTGPDFCAPVRAALP